MNGENLEVAAACSVDDDVGKAGDAHLSFENLAEVTRAGRSTDVGPVCSKVRCCTKSAEEPIAETVDTVLVPELCLHHLACGKGVEPDASTHLMRRDSATLSMTSSHESVTSSPESIWFAR